MTQRISGLASFHCVRAFAPAVACVLLLAACGGGGSGSSSTSGSSQGAPPPPPAAANQAPTISGTPATSVQAGTAYTFTPSAQDSDGNALTFSITNKPSWASFDAQTGRLTGTPADAGSFPNIVIAVSDGSSTAGLAEFGITVNAAPTGAASKSVTLAWTPPTTRTDGSTLSNLAGYKIRYGTSESNYSQTITVTNAGLTTYTIDSLSAGTYYFVVAAYDNSGLESNNSDPVSKTIG